MVLLLHILREEMLNHQTHHPEMPSLFNPYILITFEGFLIYQKDFLLILSLDLLYLIYVRMNIFAILLYQTVHCHFSAASSTANLLNVLVIE